MNKPLVFVKFISLLSVAVFASTSEPIRVCVNSMEPFYYAKDAQWVGVEHDILAGFAESQGAVLERLDLNTLEDVFAGLQDKKCEIGAALLAPTPERKERFDFSSAYFPVRMLLVANGTCEVHEIEDLGGKRVATIKGSSYEEILVKVPEIELIYSQTYAQLGEILASRQAETLICDSAIVVSLMRQNPEFTICGSLFGRGHYAFALRKSSPLTEALSQYIDKLRDKGAYRDLLEKYFEAKIVELIVGAE
ncbi:MAG: amino acid ABC transporter substrate-binding protein [bacterium]|nr:amino acid ABC transporter substrate-binding protein [bacterium]